MMIKDCMSGVCRTVLDNIKDDLMLHTARDPRLNPAEGVMDNICTMMK